MLIALHEGVIVLIRMPGPKASAREDPGLAHSVKTPLSMASRSGGGVG